MSDIPREKSLDSSLAFLSEGYNFISNRCRRFQSDIFETRIMLKKVFCTMGEEAAAMFYQPDRFTRVQAMPSTALMLLQDFGSVELLDGEAHRQRKRMFMSLMNPAAIAKLSEAVAEQWRARIEHWQTMDKVVLHEQVEEILCRAICQWSAVPLPDAEAKQRTRELAAMINGAGSVGPNNWRGMLLRTRTERWARHLIAQVRAHKLDVPEASALHVIAWHQELNGELLPENVAAVELLNILRPTVAIARFITFSALALHNDAESRQRLQQDEGDYLAHFVTLCRKFAASTPSFLSSAAVYARNLVGAAITSPRAHGFSSTCMEPTTMPVFGRIRRCFSLTASKIGMAAPSTLFHREAATMTSAIVVRVNGLPLT